MCKYTDVCNCTQYCVNIQLVKGSYPKKSYKGLIWQTKQKPPPTSTSPIQQTHCQFGSKPISIKCQFPQQSCGRTKYQWVGHDNNSPIRDKYTNPMPIWPIQYHILATYQPQVQKKLSIIDFFNNKGEGGSYIVRFPNPDYVVGWETKSLQSRPLSVCFLFRTSGFSQSSRLNYSRGDDIQMR